MIQQALEHGKHALRDEPEAIAVRLTIASVPKTEPVRGQRRGAQTHGTGETTGVQMGVHLEIKLADRKQPCGYPSIIQ